MGRLVTVSTCSLNQWALDFIGNRERIIESIRQAKAAKSSLRVGPELEICGYGCLDHYLETDTYDHSWEQLVIILQHPDCQDVLLDIGMPVEHLNLRYNCRIIALNGKILLIRPKLSLANDGNYREMRHFSPWKAARHVEEYTLQNKEMQKLQGAFKVPIGDAIIKTPDTSFAAETCEELFTPDSPHIDLGLNGVEIVTNSSGSHHTLRKLDVRLSLILEASRKGGGIYIYANQQGCDGDRLYYDGSALICINGEIVGQGSQFSLTDVEVVTATVDLEVVRSFRCAPSRGLQANKAPSYQTIETPYELCSTESDLNPYLAPSPYLKPRYHTPEEEIHLSTGCYLWDYLRRSGAAGYLIPLSGGLDSCATATTVFGMCRIVSKELYAGNEQVIADVKRICKYSDKLPITPKQICNQIFHSVYMGMSKQSSKETRARASALSSAIGTYHNDIDIDNVYEAQRNLVVKGTGFEPKFRKQGAPYAVSLALENIQSRSRMVTAYLFAQLGPSIRNRPGGGGLLVLGSANVGEALRGYYTKYDCSSADINPIGSIDKDDLKKFIFWCKNEFNIPVLQEFLDATPTAELEPIEEDYAQSDEVDMGMSYSQLSIMGRLRKVSKLGPYGMFEHLVREWKDTMTAREVADLVKRFYHYYAINRHKMTILTPSLHSNDYSPDDNRFDLRPFLLPPFYQSWQFKRIDELLARIEKYDKEEEKRGKEEDSGRGEKKREDVNDDSEEVD
ncbi:putative glutamine dependent NAD synthetase [Tothia fuscella]|uniref:Glutamine-dependent NAD(+) synthetase n=1 Tax=Tothia fuscella TaxID=1048955 RepID=A0A9P4TXD5_9PEZI|nr:putative glutamine dependent NAD synthetase [Tothia fuscella]